MAPGPDVVPSTGERRDITYIVFESQNTKTK